MREPPVTAIRYTETGVELDIDLPPSLMWFDGHFPGFAVLPGVVQVDWAVAAARQHLGFDKGAATRIQVKFKQMIHPGDAITLALSLDAKARVVFAYRKGDEACASGVLA